MRARCQGPGVQVVAAVPVAGPVPPPIIMVMPEFSASSICCGQMKWMWLSMPPAVRILPSPAIASVPGPMMMSTPGCTSGLPALPIADDAAVAQADIGLDDAGVVDDQRVGDDGVDGTLRARGLALPHAVADHLAAAELHLLAVGGEVLLHLDHEVGIGQPHLVAGGGPEHVGVGGAGDFHRHVRKSVRGQTRKTVTPEPSQLAHDLLAEAVDLAPCRRTGRGSPRASGPARSARRCRRGCRGGVRARCAVELQGAVGLGEMIVRADLDRPVAGVRHRQRRQPRGRR